MSRRRALIAILVLGVALTLAPLAFGMFSRAPQGATMLHDFRPFMTERRLTRFQGYMRQIGGAVQHPRTRMSGLPGGATV